MRSLTFGVLLCLTLSGPTALLGQERAVAPGQRLRVWREADGAVSPRLTPTTGVLRAWVGDTIHLVLDRLPEEEMIPLLSVQRLYVSAGEGSRPQSAGRAAGVGLVIGALGGGLIGFLQGDDPPGWIAFTAADKALAWGSLLGVSGAVAGALYGYGHPGERWERVQLAQ